MILSVRSLRQEVLAAYEAAKVADKAWQAELDARGIDRHTARARGAVDPDLRTLYENKIAADQKLRELTETMSLFQDPRQVIG